MAETDPRLAVLERRWLEEPSPAASMPLAEEFRRLGRHREAVAVLESALRAQPSHTAAQVALGRCLLECERPDQAASVLQDVLRRDPEQLVANRLLIDALIQRRDAAGSRRQLAAYESLNRRDPALAELRAKIEKLAAGEAAQSLFDLEQARPSTLDLTELLPRAPQARSIAAVPPLAALDSTEPSRDATGEPFPQLFWRRALANYLRALIDGWRELWGVRRDAGAAVAVLEAPAALPPFPAAAEPVPEPLAGLDATPPASLLDELPAAPVHEQAASTEASALPATREVSATLGELYLQQGHAGDAAKIFQQVLERSPADEAATEGLRSALRGADAGAGGAPKPSRALRVERLRAYLERIRRGRARVVR